MARSMARLRDRGSRADLGPMATTLPTHGASAPAGAFAPPDAPHAPQEAPAAAIACANCGWSPCGAYCPRCGQETRDLHRSLAGILGEMLDAFAGWDGKIPATLWLMVRRPGALTREFLAGHRVRYLRPLRLYLTMSVLFFLSIRLVSAPDAAPPSRTLAARIGAARSPQSGIQFDSGATALIARHRNERGTGVGVWFRRSLTGGLARLREMPPARRQHVIRDGFAAKAPNMIFLLLPVFALLLRALYWRAPVYYAEHFVFALHNHAFAYLAMTLARLSAVWLEPVGLARLAVVPLLWMPVYFFVSMRRVYGGSRRRTLAKYVTLGATYGALLIGATIATTLLAVFDLA